MPEPLANVYDSMFSISINNLGVDIDGFLEKVKNYVIQQEALGFTFQEVIQELEAQQENGLGLFAQIGGDIERQVEDGLNRIFQIESNQGIAEKVIWQLDPEAEHCESCLYQASLGARPINEVPIPGSQPTIGKDNCEIYCKCSLIPSLEG